MSCPILPLAPFPVSFPTRNHQLFLQPFPKLRSLPHPLPVCSDLLHLKTARLDSSSTLNYELISTSSINYMPGFPSPKLTEHPPTAMPLSYLSSPFDEITNICNFLWIYHQSALTVSISTPLSIKGSQSVVSLLNGNIVQKVLIDNVGFILMMVKHNLRDNKLRAGFFIIVQRSINIHAQKAPIMVVRHRYNFYKYLINKSYFYDLQFLCLLFFVIIQHSWLTSPSIIVIISKLKDEVMGNISFSTFPCTFLVKNNNFVMSPQHDILPCGDIQGSWKWVMLDTRRNSTFFWLVLHRAG